MVEGNHLAEFESQSDTIAATLIPKMSPPDQWDTADKMDVSSQECENSSKASNMEVSGTESPTSGVINQLSISMTRPTLTLSPKLRLSPSLNPNSNPSQMQLDR